MKQNGIIVAGHMCVDVLKKIDSYPGPCNLTTIRSVSQSPGGIVPNCIRDLALLDPSLPLKAVGMVGDDDYGHYLLQVLSTYPNIDASGVKLQGQTSFSDVMYDSEAATRAFFQFRGCCDEFTEDDIDFNVTKGDILHVGYILLMEALDKADDEYGTHMARLLARAREAGIKTSIDVVSEESDRYSTVVAPALRYTDYCVINEIEAARITGIDAVDENEKVIEENMPRILAALRELGVKDWIIIHCKSASYGLDKDGTYIRMDAIDIPRSLIAGTTGAGDAYCSGVLYAAYREWSLEQAMAFGTAVASSSLLTPGASDGIRSWQDTLDFAAQYPTPAVSIRKL